MRIVPVGPGRRLASCSGAALLTVGSWAMTAELPPAGQAGALVDMRALAPQEVRRAGFRLTADQEVRIRAVGAEDSSERFMWTRFAQRSEPVPQPWSGNAWIVDLRTRQTVWELSRAATERGASRTRTFDGAVRLPAGTYAAYYSSFPDVDTYTHSGLTKHITLSRGWRDTVDAFGLTIGGNGTSLTAADLEGADNDARAGAIVAFPQPGRQQLKQAGFALTRPLEIDILAIGEAREDGEFDYGWIINADTREKVWRMTWRDSTPAGGAIKNRLAHTTLSLPAGRYAAFYGTDDSHDPSEWNAPPPHDPTFWGLLIKPRSGSPSSAVKTFVYEHLPVAGQFLSLTKIGDSDLRSKGVTLNRAMDVRIYAIGEGRAGQMFDYAWITRGSSRQRVWAMRFDDTEQAGGDPKNRLVDKVLRLEPGAYVVHYASDDSHSFTRWNASPPADADHWGITLLAADGTLERGVVGEYVEKPDPSVIAEISRVRDDDRVEKRFTLTRETAVRIFALGEGVRNDMVDFGWIEDVKSGRRVWEMTYRTTEHGGGAQKNRRFDGTITLPAGEYVLVYQSDDSHAFGAWNAAPPEDPEAWGITVSKTDTAAGR